MISELQKLIAAGVAAAAEKPLPKKEILTVQKPQNSISLPKLSK